MKSSIVCVVLVLLSIAINITFSAVILIVLTGNSREITETNLSISKVFEKHESNLNKEKTKSIETDLKYMNKILENVEDRQKIKNLEEQLKKERQKNDSSKTRN